MLFKLPTEICSKTTKLYKPHGTVFVVLLVKHLLFMLHVCDVYKTGFISGYLTHKDATESILNLERKKKKKIPIAQSLLKILSHLKTSSDL